MSALEMSILLGFTHLILTLGDSAQSFKALWVHCLCTSCYPDRPSHCFLSGPWDPLEDHLLCARDPVLDAICAVDQANMEGRIDKSCREAWCVDASSYFFPLPPWTVREASDCIQPTPTQTRNHGHLLLSTNKLALSAWKLSRKF